VSFNVASVVFDGRQKDVSVYVELVTAPFSSVAFSCTPPVQFHVIECDRLNGSLTDVAKELPQDAVPAV
jgi:hypothetical protein